MILMCIHDAAIRDGAPLVQFDTPVVPVRGQRVDYYVDVTTPEQIRPDVVTLINGKVKDVVMTYRCGTRSVEAIALVYLERPHVERKLP